MTVSVLFVCLGNICRSQLAEGVLRHKVKELGIANQFTIDSAGTGSWHVGNPPDARGIEAAASRGFDISGQRARQLHAGDFGDFHYLLAMDRSNLAVMEDHRPPGFEGKLDLFLEFSGLGNREVPDPYYGSEGGFYTCLDLIEAGCDGLLKRLA